MHSIRRATRKKSGKGLEDELNRKLNLEQYLLWLAFNSLFENGDSRNELYLFEERAADVEWGRLGMVAWDFDDVQEEPIRRAETLREGRFGNLADRFGAPQRCAAACYPRGG